MANSELTLSQCKEYIKNIKNLEVESYQLNLLHDELSKRMSQLDKKVKTLSRPGIPQQKETVMSHIFSGIFSMIPGAIIGLIIGFIVWAFGGEGFLHNFEYGRDVPLQPYLFVGALITAVIAFILGLSKTVGIKKRNETRLQEYRVQEYNRKDNLQYFNSLRQKLQQSINECQAQRVKTYSLLTEYYNYNYIYPDYRGLVPICMIYQYFDSGRCVTLTGHEGAYNLYESELRMNRILGKLDDIIVRLDEIRDSQRILANELKQSDQNIAYLCNSVDTIGETTELIKYYNRITAANSTYLVWMDILKNKY